MCKEKRENIHKIPHFTPSSDTLSHTHEKMFSSNSPSLFCTKTPADAGVTTAAHLARKTRNSARQNTSSKRQNHQFWRRMMTQKKKVYVAFSSVHDDENDSSSNTNNTNDAISSYSTKEKQLLRKLLLHEGQALTRSRAEEQQLKEQLEKRKKKLS